MIPELMNTIALLKREEEQDPLGTPPVRGKLTHYLKKGGIDKNSITIYKPM